MKKESKMPVVVIGAIILTIVALPFAFLSYALYFAWDSQQSGEFYKPAFEANGTLYDLRMQGNSLAFDSGTREDHLFINSPHILSGLIALGDGDFEIEKTDNPFFAGALSIPSHKYGESETKYRNPKDSYLVYRFYDRDRNLVFAYEPATESEFVVRLRPTFPAFAKRKYGIGDKREYLDATAILKAKLGKNLVIRTDEENKLLILKFVAAAESTE
ncbi:MAG TPA: hypothetical protein VIL74_11305 [Pyrinomonadaceae bacterium]|jgi:hypothetical protein